MKNIILLAFLFLTNISFSQNTDSLNVKLSEYFEALTDLNNFNGNVLISQNGKILLDKTFNIKAQSDSLRVNKDSKFIIASVSKVFIKFGILKLVEQKQLQLDDKLSKFIPDFPAGNKITIEQLMHHRSGLPRELKNYEQYDSLSLQKTVELAKLEKLEFEPDSKMLYSNVGYFLLHFIIEKTSKDGYQKFMNHLIVNELHLQNTYEFNSVKKITNFAYGFDNEKGKITATSKKNINRFETGNYYSTIADMFLFSEEIVSGKVLDKSLAFKMFGADSTLIQAGGRPGYRAYLYKNLKTNVTFIFLSNYSDIPVQQVANDVVNILANKPYEIPHKTSKTKIELNEKILKRYVGKFALEADVSQIFTIQLENGKLLVSDKSGEKTEIFADSETTFFEDPNSKDSYVFELNQLTQKYDLTIFTSGMKLKTKRLK